jgi:hypothetical protein
MRCKYQKRNGYAQLLATLIPRAYRADLGTLGPDAWQEMDRACQCGAQSASLVDMGQSNMMGEQWRAGERRTRRGASASEWQNELHGSRGNGPLESSRM